MCLTWWICLQQQGGPKKYEYLSVRCCLTSIKRQSFWSCICRRHCHFLHVLFPKVQLILFNLQYTDEFHRMYLSMSSYMTTLNIINLERGSQTRNLFLKGPISYIKKKIYNPISYTKKKIIQSNKFEKRFSDFS